MKIDLNNNFLQKIIFFFLVSSNFLLIIKQNLLDENSTISIILIYGYLYGIVFFQIIFLIIINKYFKNLFNFFLVSLLFYNL